MTKQVWNKGSQEDFINRAKEVHGDKYSYELVEYVNARAKVSITCNVHNWTFEQAPGTHLSGKGCRKCADDLMASLRRADVSHFIEKAVKRHGDRYDYSRVVYKNAKTNVEIVCKEHGAFVQKPDNHWSGQGCPGCGLSGYDSTKRGTLYVLSCGDITKVGITNRDVSLRVKQISKDFGAEFNLVTKFNFSDGLACSQVETELLRKLRGVYRNPSHKFDGYSECFLEVDRPSLVNQIKELMHEYT